MILEKTVLVTGVGGAAGVFLINHLKKNGFRVIAVDSNPCSYGLMCGDVNIVVPDCLDPKYVSVIKHICIKEKVFFIFPLIDEELTFLKTLESETLKVICPQIEFIELCLDKSLLMKELSQIGACVPKTALLSEDFSFIKFPAIVKPKTGRGSKDVYIICDSSELNKIIYLKKDCLDKFLIQEKIEGEEYTVSVVVNPDNHFITVVPKRVIEKKGITKMAITENNSKIECVSENITNIIKPFNSFNVQLIVNKVDMMPYIFEINPRYSTTTTLTIAAGVDEIMAPLNFYLEPHAKTIAPFTEGLVLMRSVKEEFVEHAAYSSKVEKIEQYD